ncbi:MAG: AsmA-like C-terminal domain-containing protein, partial [Sphingomonadales bacterium]|nr:AsmA-like C-terminal domain-containing protein [Sphingomonadales bacterium]
SLGIEVPDVLARYMRGGAKANVSYTTFNDGQQSLSARVDLANVDLSAPEFGWQKLSGVPGTAVLELRLKDDVPKAIPNFSVTAPDMDISGSVSFLEDGALERIDLDTMRSGLTDVVGSLMPTENDVWEVVLRGESLDVGVLWDEMVGIRDRGDAAQDTPKDSRDDPREDQLRVHAAIDISNLIIRKDRVLHDLIGTVYRDRGLWRKMDIVGIAEGESTVEVLLDTAPDGLRYLSIASNDAGATLKTLDLYDNIRGGQFDLKAAYTRPGKGAALEGAVKLTDYAMIDAPTFTKLIGIMSLTGVLDALKGGGLNFSILDAPFKLEDGVLELTQARASGATLGVTASGRVDMANRVLNLKGTVVPAYAINALLGKIPLIGELFTGSEKGGGLFAATYTMKGQGDNVDIVVNPLSALAPGALRDIFTGSGKESDIP